jgi:dihydroorotate dehydrogenase electron transfer subunit
MREFQEKSRVTVVEQLSPDVYRMKVHAPYISAAAQPGQFVMVRVADRFDPLLRRPFSIHGCFDDGDLSLLFKVVGKGTHMLASVPTGADLDLIGPLGRGFELIPKGPVCLVGGGMGTAPLLFLAGRLQAAGHGTEQEYILLGSRNRAEVSLLAAECSVLGYQVRVATDDGSMGHHGLVPELLDQVLHQVQQVYTCGPFPMMRTVADQCRQAGVACQVSLEATMACGLGACLGCTLPGVNQQYVHVCRQGPVFSAEEVAW